MTQTVEGETRKGKTQPQPTRRVPRGHAALQYDLNPCSRRGQGESPMFYIAASHHPGAARRD